MNRWIRTAAVAAFACVARTPAQAQPSTACDLQIDNAAINWTIPGYDPLGNDVPSALFDLTFRNEGTGDCQFVPILSLPGEPYGLSDGSGDRIPYAVIDRYATYDMTPLSGQTPLSVTRRSVVLSSGQQQTLSFQLTIDPDQLRRDGNFVQQAVLEAVQSDGLRLAGRPLAIGINVLPSARVGLSGAFTLSGGRPVVDLGELIEGPVQLPLRLRVQSTRRYRVSFESLHGGNLQLAESNWRIPYSITVDNQSIPLAGGAGEYLDQTGQGYREDSLPLGFVVGDTSARRAGVYSDVLTVSVAPQ